MWCTINVKKSDILNNDGNFLINKANELIENESFRLFSANIDYDVDIDEITNNLSNVIAQSKVNISSLPMINEFENHKILVNDAVTTAENLHGRYLGALRNNEYDVALSISQAILLNKETESRAFENALLEFKEKSLINYANFENLP